MNVRKEKLWKKEKKIGSQVETNREKTNKK